MATLQCKLVTLQKYTPWPYTSCSKLATAAHRAWTCIALQELLRRLSRLLRPAPGVKWTVHSQHCMLRWDLQGIHCAIAVPPASPNNYVSAVYTDISILTQQRWVVHVVPLGCPWSVGTELHNRFLASIS